jgi:hypothetical protein
MGILLTPQQQHFIHLVNKYPYWIFWDTLHYLFHNVTFLVHKTFTFFLKFKCPYSSLKVNVAPRFLENLSTPGMYYVHWHHWFSQPFTKLQIMPLSPITGWQYFGETCSLCLHGWRITSKSCWNYESVDVTELYRHITTKMANQNYRKGYRECPSLGQQEVHNETCEKTWYRTTSMKDMKSSREKQLHIYSPLQHSWRWQVITWTPHFYGHR